MLDELDNDELIGAITLALRIAYRRGVPPTIDPAAPDLAGLTALPLHGLHAGCDEEGRLLLALVLGPVVLPLQVSAEQLLRLSVEIQQFVSRVQPLSRA